VVELQQDKVRSSTLLGLIWAWMKKTDIVLVDRSSSSLQALTDSRISKPSALGHIRECIPITALELGKSKGVGCLVQFKGVNFHFGDKMVFNHLDFNTEDAYRLTEGRAVFASGSPFDPVFVDGRKFIPSQGNNAYIFPGLGLGIVASGSRRVTNGMLLAAAGVLASELSETDLNEGRIYPPVARIREVSIKIATAVASVAYNQGLAATAEPAGLESYIRAQVFEPNYRNYA
jgi:Malic enzyme, NAD binding domain